MLVLYIWRTYHGISINCYAWALDCAMTRQIQVDCDSIDRVGLILLFNTAIFLTWVTAYACRYQLSNPLLVVGLEIRVETIWRLCREFAVFTSNK